MSKYTTQLRFPIEQFLEDRGLTQDEANWQECYRVIGLDDYPIFDESHRQVLNDKIIRAYYFREIGFETVALFRWQMRRYMHEIMPYYNQLYESELLITDPLLSKNLDYTEEWTRDEITNRTGKSSTNVSASSDTDDRNVFQDTPMNELDTGAVKSLDYATNVTYDDTTTTTKSETSNASENDYTGDYDGTKKHNQKGYDQSQSELLLTYRETFLNIDLEIVKRVDVLFMQLW